jgi:hypothetical protein
MPLTIPCRTSWSRKTCAGFAWSCQTTRTSSRFSCARCANSPTNAHYQNGRQRRDEVRLVRDVWQNVTLTPLIDDLISGAGLWL